MLAKISVVASQESWEEDGGLYIEGYRWFGKPRTIQNSQRGEESVYFLVCGCLVKEVSSVKYAESMWMERGESQPCV